MHTYYRLPVCYWLSLILFLSHHLPLLLAAKVEEHALSPRFKGLILVSKVSDLNPAGYENVHGILPYHIELPGNITPLKKSISPLLGLPLDQATLKAIKSHIMNFYKKYHRPIVVTTIPNQDASHGTLQIVVKEPTIGKITVKGNRWFRSDKIMENIHLKIGQPIASNTLKQDLYWLNRNPFRQVNAALSPGEIPGTTDIAFRVYDRLPFRVYGGVDNTGNDATGETRLIAGFNWANLFHTDQMLSYQFMSSYDVKRFHSHSIFYEALLPWWYHSLNIYGGYSHIDTTIPGIDTDSYDCQMNGFSLQASLRYAIPLRAHKNFLHEVICGFDFKRTNNTLEFIGLTLASKLRDEKNVNLTQLMLGYNLGYKPEPIKLSFAVEGFYSPGKWISDQSTSAYDSLRPGSSSHYFYTRSAFTFAWDYYKKWSMRHVLRGQIATQLLLPSEEYGVGGYNTVRGYKERLLNGDGAFIWNFELYTPPLNLIALLSSRSKLQDELKLLIFLDYGLTYVNQTVETEKSFNHIIGAGPGLRYNITPYLTLRADWGIQLYQIGNAPTRQTNNSWQRFHFSVIAGY
ncbi:MAG: ShlB/FhaC/HecB family hemolysin secretion/activation protein [Chlamydiota bacterium]